MTCFCASGCGLSPYSEPGAPWRHNECGCWCHKRSLVPSGDGLSRSAVADAGDQDPNLPVVAERGAQ